MFSLETLDVLIGLTTIYLMFGIACTSAVEAITSWLRIRASNLKDALDELFPGKTASGSLFVEQFYAHPLVESLSQGPNGRPSYIPPEIVSRVVESLLLANNDAQSLQDAIAALPNDDESKRLKGLLAILAQQAEGEIEHFRLAVEHHFNAVMDRASGWYKRYTQKITLVVASMLVIGANIDSIALATSLASNPAARLKSVEVAEQALMAAKTREETVSKTAPNDEDSIAEAKKIAKQAAQNVDSAKNFFTHNGLPMGWASYPTTAPTWVAKVVGLLVSIFAISLGAPFWFSVLQRFMQVRATGVLPEEKGKH